MPTDNSVKKWFGKNLAELLASKITEVYPDFESNAYIQAISDQYEDKAYTQLIELHADTLNAFLPKKYEEAIGILIKILGPENPNETGMFTNFYWVMPISKYIEKYGIDFFDTSLLAIEEVTKRSTGEYAIRPFIRKYPEKTLKKMTAWSQSNNFHLRRLASEGLRPKLPWATKLDVFIEEPKPVFALLENLIEDDSKFVQKSVANNIRDYVKVNQEAALQFIQKHSTSKNKNTQWILRHATRKGIL